MDSSRNPTLDWALTAADIGRGVPDDPRLVVEIWLVLRDAQHLLMLKRSARRGGFWQGVSGRVEATDHTLRDAALREVHEETGLSPDRSDFFDLRLGYAYRGLMSGTAFRKRSLGLWLPPGLESHHVDLSDEHTEKRVVPLDEVGALLRFDEMHTELETLAQVLAASGRRGD